MSNFDLSNLALQAICPGNEILYDNKGKPSIMVKIPKQSYKQLGLGESEAIHPAFLVNGQEVDAIWISKYQNIEMDGRAYSLPGQDPKHSINFDTARGYCESKGEGWHLMTRAEWSLLALWCKQNGFLPYGNNDYGKDSRESNFKAIPTSTSSGRTNRVATGSGPLTWSHDKTPAGIWDLNGNVSEWVGGMRLVAGELQVLENNNAADSGNSQAAAGTDWKAIDGVTGAFVSPGSANTLKLDYVSNAWKWITGSLTSSVDEYRSSSFESITADASVGAEAIMRLKALALLKHDDTAGAYEGDQFYANNGAAERLFSCGGSWSSAASAGVFYSNGHNPRTDVYTSIGFRSAYVKLPSA